MKLVGESLRLAHLVSCWVSNSRLIFNTSSNSWFFCKKLISKTISTSKIKLRFNQMLIEVNKSDQVTVRKLNAIRLKIRGTHFRCKIANECLNVREQVEVVHTNKDGLFPFHALSKQSD